MDDRNDPPQNLDEARAKATIKLDMSGVFDEAVGQTLGRYKLLEKIGEGGCGTVYIAEQTVPVRRRVALKVIKLGMDTKQIVARFEAERQALAMMDHPNIAKVLDAGATETGRPYFVMELVRGIKITDYCDQHQMAIRERMDLFIKVCQAIQHAHQKGIVHRDIKPSNILVASHDGTPSPKVIDFGIAKATEGRLTEATIYTQMYQFIGTPAYMSPEQVSGVDIDTRSDIYSLGVLLYELLVGTTPFDGFLLAASGIEPMRRTIQNAEPVRPSTRFATLKGQDLADAAKNRSDESAKVLRQIKGDLDWIVMKCLEKDRTRRYETANGLAFDLKRHLDNEAVHARPPSTSYRLQKAFRRNKVVFAAGTAIALALILGVIGTTLGLLRADKHRRLAEEAGREATKLKDEAVNLLAAEKEERARAQAEELAARRAAYISEMNLAYQALAANNLGRARRFLNRQRPQAGQKDLREWEWRYLWSQTRTDDHEILFAGTNRIPHPLSFSADGRLLVRAEGSEIVVSDLLSRREVFRRPHAWRPVFAPQGNRLAFVEKPANNDTIVLLDLVSQKEIRLETTWQMGTDWIGFTPDGHCLLTVSKQPGNDATTENSHLLTAWDIQTRRKIWQKAMGGADTSNGRPYAFSPDNVAFAAVLPDGRVRVFNLQDGTERFTVKVTEEYAMAVAFSMDNSTLVTGAGYGDPIIRLWDARNGTARGVLEGHRSWVSDLLFTPDGRFLLSSSGDQTIRLWDWSKLQPATVLCGHLDEVDGLALAPGGRNLVSRCKDGSIYLWDLNKPSQHPPYQTLPSRLNYASTLFTPDSRSILAVELKGGVALWDTFARKETRRLWGDSTNGIDFIISPDARRIVRGDNNGRVHVWDAGNGLEQTNLLIAPTHFLGWITDNGKFLVTIFGSSTNKMLEVWTMDTWEKTGSLRLPFPDFRWAYTTSRPNSIVLWDGKVLWFYDAARLNETPRQIKTEGDVLGLAASPDGRLLAGAFEDGSVQLWDLSTLKFLESLKGFLLAATSVAFSPDGQRLAASSHGQEAVKLWDVETRQEVLTLGGEGSQFLGLQFSSDDRSLLAVSMAGLAHLWTAPTWKEIEAAEADEARSAQK
jgi:WD40 repeat protein/serine/threonine protein kinase